MIARSTGKIEYPSIAIVILCIMDIVTTIIGLRLGAVEANQIAFLIGLPVFLGIKLIATAAVAIIMVKRHNGKQIYGNNMFTKRLSPKWLWLVVSLLSLVIVNNLVTIAIHLSWR